MTKEELLESYATNLRKKLNELNFNAVDQESTIAHVLDIKLAMWNRLNDYFREHFIDDLTDDAIDAYFQEVAKRTAEIISTLPIAIRSNLN